MIYILGIVWDVHWSGALFGMFTGLLTHSSIMIRKQCVMTSYWAISHVSVELEYSLSKTNLQTLNINSVLRWLIVWELLTAFSHSKSFKSCTERNLLQCFREWYIRFNILTIKKGILFKIYNSYTKYRSTYLRLKFTIHNAMLVIKKTNARTLEGNNRNK